MRALPVCVLLVATPARADERRHLVYAEALGKGGLYGLGYERVITSRLALGAATSFAVIRGQRITTLAAYVHATIVRGTRHRLFAEVGPILAHSRWPSPVAGWDGIADTGGGGFVALGWELATPRLVIRASGAVAVGEGGIGPMVGFAIGARP